MNIEEVVNNSWVEEENENRECVYRHIGAKDESYGLAPHHRLISGYPDRLLAPEVDQSLPGPSNANAPSLDKNPLQAYPGPNLNTQEDMMEGFGGQGAVPMYEPGMEGNAQAMQGFGQKQHLGMQGTWQKMYALTPHRNTLVPRDAHMERKKQKETSTPEQHW